MLPTGVGSVEESNGGWEGSRAVVHSLGVGGCEGKWWAVSLWSKKESMKDIAPTAKGTDCHRNENFVMVKDASYDLVTRYEDTRIVSHALT